ncbi:MAG: lytic transglycosylase domain-containing protein [Burkholderiales bacterium]
MERGQDDGELYHRGMRGYCFAVTVGSTLALACAHARAEVWGYIDEQGRAHIATEKVDERYRLFFKGPTKAQLDAKMARAAREAELAALMASPAFERLVTHPNAARFDALITRHAKANELPVPLVKAMIAAESGYEPAAVSTKGALGLMQVMPDTAMRYGIADDGKRTLADKLFDPETNVRVGTRYLKDLLRLFGNDLELALAAYNAGEAAVQRYDNRIPPFPETQEYVKLVTQLYAYYTPPAPPVPPARVTIPRKPAGER